MHINRELGEQVKVDWAGDLAHVIDPDTGEITDTYIIDLFLARTEVSAK